MCLTETDVVARCIIFAKAFDGDSHVDGKLFVFQKSAADGACHESLVLRRVTPADHQVHEIGCGIARKQNSDRKEPSPGPSRKYYCGFREAQVSRISQGGDGFEIRLTWDKDPEESHVDISLLVSATTKNEKANIRTEATMVIASAFGPATAHICDEDRIDEMHPLVKNPSCLVPQDGGVISLDLTRS